MRFKSLSHNRELWPNAKLDTCGIRALCRRTEAEETAKKELEDMDEDDD